MTSTAGPMEEWDALLEQAGEREAEAELEEEALPPSAGFASASHGSASFRETNGTVRFAACAAILDAPLYEGALVV